MSVALMTAAWRLDIPTTDKMVLLALADAANDDGVTWIAVRSKSRIDREGNPKQDLLAKCSLSERAIQGAIKRLCEQGYLRRDEKPGRGVIYFVTPAANAPRSKCAPQEKTETPAAGAGKPSTNRQAEAKASLQRVVEAYNLMAGECGCVRSQVQDASLRQKIHLRLKEHGEEVLLRAIAAVRTAPWLRGEGRDSKWRVDLDWLMTPAKLRKVIEGTYGQDAPAPRRLTSEDVIQRAEDAAARYRRIGRDSDADEELAKAARLRAGQGVGPLAQKILGEVRPL